MEKDESVILEVRVRPNAAKTCVKEVGAGFVVVDVAAPPQKNRANQELIRYLAKLFSISKSQVEIVRGETSKHKWVRIPVGHEELWRRLESLC